MSPRYLAGVLAVAAVYVACVRAGVPLQPADNAHVPAWSPAGPALALLLLFGPRFWPGVLIGAILEQLRPGFVGLSAVGTGMAVGLTLQPLVVSSLLRRLGFDTAMVHLRDVLAFLLVGVVLGPVISATFGSTTLALLQHMPFDQVWSSWWMADARSILVITPLLIAVRSLAHLDWRPKQVIEVAILLPSMAVFGCYAFGLVSWEQLHFDEPAYLLFPWLVWAAVRLGPPGAAAANALLAAIALWATRTGTGPFIQTTAGASFSATEAYMLISAATSLILAANIRERQRAAAEIVRLKADAELSHQSLHDSLTGLPNRVLFSNRLEKALGHAEKAGAVAVLIVDLDNFKVVNDSLCHTAGDELLVAVANRLQSCLGPGASAARLGGDEFAVLLEGLQDESSITSVADEIAAIVNRPTMVNGREVLVTASIGVAVQGPTLRSASALLQAADLALYRAKAAGKARHAVFHPDMEREAAERLELEGDLRRALERGEIRVYYQPIVRLSDGEISEVEALVRWAHPERGLVPPAQFIPVAEETGLIIPLGRRVLEEACMQVRLWQTAQPQGRPLVLGVNLSARQFQDPGLVADIQRVLATSRLEPASLKLEITESAAMHDVEATVAILSQLKAVGIQVAIDDFGTGYSSLNYLKQFPVDTLKIDRSFVDGLGQDPHDTAIVRSVLGLARTLHLTVTAEGIETSQQEHQLRRLGCDRGQGYLFARPLPEHELTALLARKPGVDDRAA